MSAVRSRLSVEQEKKLCSLFGHVKFSLLYKASVHGYSAAVFHQKCDRQGPTITVAYNKAGFVYGGYTSKDFAQTGQYLCDEKAFLFSIHDNTCTKNAVSIAQNAVLDNNTGPNFGGSLIFLNNNTAITYSAPGNVYDLKAEEMHGNDLNLIECEVYRVEEFIGSLLDKPWRNVIWETENKKVLMDFTKNYKPSINSVSHARVLLIGPIGAGKSSFFNSINSVFRGHVTSQAISGSASTSLTKQFRTYNVKVGRDGKQLPIVLCDTMGLEEASGSGLHIDDISNILKGHVADRYQFNPSSSLDYDAKGFRKSVNLQDKIHCVAYVIDACKVAIMSPKLEEKLAAVRQRVNAMAVPQLVILTKVDEACPLVAEDITNVYRSRYMQMKIQEVSSRLGVPVSCVVPVKNYSQELELDKNCDILLLSAVQQILRFTDNYFDDVYYGDDKAS